VNARSLALVALVLVAPNALADNTADEADIAFSVGNDAYAKHDYEHALAAYFLSYRLVPNRNVLFNIARCYEAQDRWDEAYRYWHDLFVDPNLPESDRRDVRQALARLAPRVALISVTSTPPGAELYVDRKDLGSRGRTPQTIAVAPGAHSLLLELAGHEATEVKASSSKGREAKAEATLSRIVGTVALTGTPAGAEIHESADGPALGTLPATLTFPPGQRLLVVTDPGHLPHQVLVDVKAKQTVSATVALTEKPQPTGKVVVTSNRDPAVVRVDGREFGFTPTVVTLALGEHVVEVSAADMTPSSERVTVVAEQEQRVYAELRYAPPKVSAASTSAMSVDQAPASVTIVSHEELLAFGYQSLAEALVGVRGLFLTDDRLYNYVGVRGFQPPGDFNTRLLILWDGHPVNDAWTGQGYAAREFDIDLSEVERLEIIRGPASILFGTGALFGVINVVPRDHLGNRHVEGVAGGGGQNGVKLRATGSLGDDRRSVLISAAGFQSAGAPSTELEQGTVQGLDGERSLGATLRAKVDDFSVVAKVNQRRKQAPTAPHGSMFGVPGTEYTDARGFAELRWEHAFQKVTLDAQVSYDGSRFRGYYAQLDAQGDRFRSTDSGGADWLSAQVRGRVSLFTGNQLSLSLDGSGQFVYQQAISLPIDLHNRVRLAGTVLDEWQLGSRFFVQVGVRVDKYNDLTTFAFSPRGALVAKVYDAGLTKLIGGRAFRAPSVYELYFNDNFATQRVPLMPLVPEYITSVELEHSHDFTPELRLTVGGYFNYIEQLVITSDDPAMPFQCSGGTVACTVYGNSPDALRALGAEAELRWRPGRFTLVDATYSFVTVRGKTQADYAYPQHLASVRAMVPVKDGLVRVSAQGTYQSARYDPSGATWGEAVLLNVGFSGEYGPVRYFAGVQNLLDARVSLPVQSEIGTVHVPQYGRTFWVELAAGF
jgi:outer membrane receptor protein involved in Fe transport